MEFYTHIELAGCSFFFSRCILIAVSYGSLLRTLYTCFFFFLLPFLYFKSFWICNQNRWQINSNRCEFLWLLPFCVGYACLPIQIDSYSWLIIFRRAIWKKTPHTQIVVPRISLNFNYRDRENKTWIEDLKSKHHFPYHLDDVLSVKFVCVFLFLRLVALLDLCGWSIWAYCMPKYTHSLQFSCGNFFIVDVRMK